MMHRLKRAQLRFISHLVASLWGSEKCCPWWTWSQSLRACAGAAPCYPALLHPGPCWLWAQEAGWAPAWSWAAPRAALRSFQSQWRSQKRTRACCDRQRGCAGTGREPAGESAEGLCHEVRDCPVASLSCNDLPRAMHGSDGGTQAAAAIEGTLGLVAACRTELRGSCERECAGGWLSASRATHAWDLSHRPCWLALHATPACNKPSAQEVVGIVTLDHLLALSGRLHSPSMPPQMSVGPA